jgi:hypothetical protein
VACVRPGVERWPFAELRLGHQLNEIGAVVMNVANALTHWPDFQFATAFRLAGRAEGIIVFPA